MNKPFREAWRFFMDHAGWANPPGRVVCAAALARAEIAYRAAEWDETGNPGGTIRFRWEADDSDPRGNFSDPRDEAFALEHGWVGCILERWNPAPGAGWECAQSLWGITESLDNRERDAYRRVIRAELASEAGFGE